MEEFVELQIINTVKKILTSRINEMLCDMKFPVPTVEFGEYLGNYAVIPSVTLSSCERTEKERIIKLDAYSLTVVFTLPETPESELYCYAYSNAVSKAINENPSLCGVANRAVITGKKYISPQKANCGEGWQLIITMRIVIEEF